MVTDDNNNQYRVINVAPSRDQIITSFRHADGDPMEIYSVPSEHGENYLTLTDCGMTLMRLSYTENITSTTLDNIRKIVNDYRLCFDDGVISINAPKNIINNYLSTFAMTISRVMALSSISLKRTKSTFYEDVDKFIMSSLTHFSPQKNYKPIESRNDVSVDYLLTTEMAHKLIFLYPVYDGKKATDVWGQINFFLNNKIDFRSLILYDDSHELSKKEFNRLTSEGDKLLRAKDFEVSSERVIKRLAS